MGGKHRPSRTPHSGDPRFLVSTEWEAEPLWACRPFDNLMKLRSACPTMRHKQIKFGIQLGEVPGPPEGHWWEASDTWRPDPTTEPTGYPCWSLSMCRTALRQEPSAHFLTEPALKPTVIVRSPFIMGGKSWGHAGRHSANTGRAGRVPLASSGGEAVSAEP